MSSISDLFVQHLSMAEMIIGLTGMIAAGSFACLMATRIGQIILPKPRESRVSDFLPFEKLEEDGTTIRCHNGTLCRIFRLGGADTAFIPPEQQENYVESRKQWVDTLSENGVTARIITVREALPTEEDAPHQVPILARLALQWSESLNRVYRNVHYAILSVPDRKNADRDLNQASQALLSTLDEYEPETLFESPNSKAEDGPFHLIAKMASPLTQPIPRVGSAEGEDLRDLLTADHVHFTGDEGIIRFHSGNEERLCIVMSLRTTADYMDEQMVSNLLSIDGELNLMHVFSPINRMKARGMLMQQKRMAAMTSFSSSVLAQYDEVMEVMEDSDANYQTMHNYSMILYLFGEDEEDLKFTESEVERVCRLHGATPVREGWVAQASFFAQFPSYEIYPRTYRFLSRAIACAMSLEQPATGHDRSDWGPGAITVFRTATGSAYQWQFHVTPEANAVAHQVVVGPTGGGKTTLLAFLAGQAMRHKDLRVYFFDRHRGVEIFTHAVGGSYITFDGDENSASLNPFSCADNAENRAFLRRWLKAITMVDDSLSEKEISRAVTTAFDYLRPEERILKNLYKACFSPTGHMRRELFRWVNDDQYGRIFNAEDDNLDLSARFMAFDFTRIFEDETLAPAVISYIMHRIHSVTGSTGDPSLIMIDETAPMLKHPMFRESFIVGLQEGRKKRQAYLCAFQQPNIVDQLGLGEVIRGQCQTALFLRNPQGTPEDYENWRLTPMEQDFIAGRAFKDLPYAVLVSRPAVGESVILDVDLGGLGPFLKLYSSGRKHVLLAEQLRQEYGPEKFVDKFLEVA